MTWVMKLNIVLLVLITNILSEQNIKTENESFNMKMHSDQDYCLIFKSSADETLLLWNTSNPLENSTLASEFRDRLKVDRSSSSLTIKDLTQSDSGQYRRECWRNGRISYQNSTELLVCSGSGKDKVLHADPGETVDLQCDGTRDGDNKTVRWFKWNYVDSTVKFVENNSSLLITNISMEDIRYWYYSCVLMEGQLCVSKQDFNPQDKREYVGLSVGEEAILPCFNYDDPTGTETQWDSRNSGGIRWESSNSTIREKQMYVLDGRTSGDYSLIIPSAKIKQSGGYVCYGKMLLKGYEVLVCPKSKPLTQFFSEGEEVVLRCNSEFTDSDRMVWYRWTTHIDSFILDTRFKLANLPQDLDGRMSASDRLSLVLSNLSLADSGEYWCAVFYKGLCISVTKTVLVEWDPFGINSTFYRVYSTLMGCALLGMVCALITVNLKTRRDQASLKTRRDQASLMREERSSRVKERESEEERGERR